MSQVSYFNSEKSSLLDSDQDSMRKPALVDILKKRSSKMLKPNSEQEATRSDFRQILGDLDDSTALAILALHPTVAQLEEGESGSTAGMTLSAKRIGHLMVS
jgi:hypothetical protein